MIEHNIQFVYACTRQEEEKNDTRPLQRRSRTQKFFIISHKTGTKRGERKRGGNSVFF